MTNLHIALYGNVSMLRGWCDSCQSWALVVDGLSACCGEEVESSSDVIKRMTHPEACRKLLKSEERRAILESQDYRCIYCEKRFDSEVERHGKIVRLRVHWDHQIPFSYSQNNTVTNIAAACQICNLMKGALIFKDIEEARIHIQGALEREERRAARRKCAGYRYSKRLGVPFV